MLLDATPRKLADAAVHWAAQQLLGENLPDKVGVCRLAWEEETEKGPDEVAPRQSQAGISRPCGGKTEEQEQRSPSP